MTNNRVKICIIDSGVKLENINIPNTSFINILKFPENNDDKINGIDNIGHGTAISSIILKFSENVDLYSLKIFENDLVCDETILVNALKYILYNVDCNIINLSLGTICPKDNELYNICLKLHEKGVIIVAAFDNNGAISYPAAYDFVIGVDTSINCRKYNDFEYVNGNFINIMAFGGIQRVAWATSKFMIASGASYACAYVTSAIANIMSKGTLNRDKILEELKNISKNIVNVYTPSVDKINNIECIKKAVLFPYNKEMHALTNFEQLLIFEIEGIYDYAKLGNIGKKIFPITSFSDNEHIIKDINSLQWDSDFDTVILGHLTEIENATNDNITKNILDLCVKYNKNIYSFDDISTYQDGMFYKNINIMLPKKDISDIKIDTFGKMYLYKSPILGIFGTSSKQGKFTLQLELRKRFLEQNFKVGQLGTEPTALLFGMDEVFPIGYNGSVYLDRNQTIVLLNQIMHNIDSQNNDIIIVGSQSGSIAYATYNLALLPQYQVDILYGTQPDGVILCINPYDDISYINRTIKAIEGMIECKVFSIVLYPMDFTNNWSKFSELKSRISEDRINKIKEIINIKFNIPCYVLGVKCEMEELFNKTVEFFS